MLARTYRPRDASSGNRADEWISERPSSSYPIIPPFPESCQPKPEGSYRFTGSLGSDHSGSLGLDRFRIYYFRALGVRPSYYRALRQGLKVFRLQPRSHAERSNHAWLLSQAADGQVKFQMEFFHVEADQVAHLDMLEVLHGAFDGIQVRGIRRQPLDAKATSRVAGKELLDCWRGDGWATRPRLPRVEIRHAGSGA